VLPRWAVFRAGGDTQPQQLTHTCTGSQARTTTLPKPRSAGKPLFVCDLLMDEGPAADIKLRPREEAWIG
jgi:hypothetical protein